MGRTLTAGATTPRRTLPTASKSAQDSQEQIVAWIFGCVADLWRYGDEWAVWHDAAQRQNTRTHELFLQLQDPELQKHPRFAAAQARYWTWERRYMKWQAHAESIERVAQGVQRSMARHLKRLTPKRRDELVSNRGWHRADDPEDIAAGMWERAKRLEVWPAGEAPFLAEELRRSAERVGLSLAWLWSRERMEPINPVPCPF